LENKALKLFQHNTRQDKTTQHKANSICSFTPLYARLLAVTCCILFVSTPIFSQIATNQGFQKTIIPSSPNAASLGKFGDIPVGSYIGVPDISIPLGELKGKLLSMPISMSYHAGGIKVDEVASSVGLGWAINSGGVITRTVRGTPDEGVDGYVTYDLDLNNYQQLWDIAVTKSRDTEADMFFFNVSGYSGKFYLERVNGSIVVRLIGFQDVKIQMVQTTTPISWKMTTPDGTIYTFAQPEYTAAPNGLDGANNENITSWYLTRVEHLSGDFINLTYRANPSELSYFAGLNETKTTEYVGNPNCQYPSGNGQSNVLQSVKMQYIETIESFHNKATFNYASREDFTTGALALQQIVFSDKNYATSAFTTVKSIDFTYGYFTSTGQSVLQPTETRHTKRLKLNSISETGFATDGTGTIITPPPHEFTYLSA
jgi:Salmonella virulence plasmid 65kDa B protein